ncbi:hypothetical protein L1987_57864 [Smallanthus sonchifolius]|uniref:Uncharacterized protein n=1 Tax=Smallanthus sonchifolius TaxID=185202 RepID=A0ACB9DDP7_9ASTR|nr:hypothetical protein L1987_57864 [Smallanthus sonchifolius]
MPFLLIQSSQDLIYSSSGRQLIMTVRDLTTDPVTYPDYFMDGCWRQRMGYVGARDYASYKKMWLLDQWRYLAHVMIMCISSRKVGNDAMGHDLAAAMLLINDALPNLPVIGERLQVKTVAKRVFSKFLTQGSVDPTPVHTPLFGHLINEAYVAPTEFRWYSAESEPDMSEHSGEHIQGGWEEKEVLSDRGDRPFIAIPIEVERRRQPHVSAEMAATTVTEDVLVIVSLPVQYIQQTFTFPTHTTIASTSRDPDPWDARIATLETQVAGLLETVRKSREESDKQQGESTQHEGDVSGNEGGTGKFAADFPKGDGEGVYELEDGEIFEAPSLDAISNTGSVEPEFVAEASGAATSTKAFPTDPQPVDPKALKSKYPYGWFTKDQAPIWQKTSIVDKHGATDGRGGGDWKNKVRKWKLGTKGTYQSL